MAKRPTAQKSQKKVETLRHPDDKRVNIPTAEHQSVLEAEHLAHRGADVADEAVVVEPFRGDADDHAGLGHHRSARLRVGLIEV